MIQPHVQLGLDAAALPALLPAAALQQQQAKGPQWLLPALRAACVAGMLGCNAAMTSCYVLALQSSGSVPATVISTAVNFVVTGVAGWALFREALSLRWWGGAGLTLMGVALVAGWGFEKKKQEPAARGGGQGRYQLRDRTPQKQKQKAS
jgi:drug/metabolite transporter (DMT)-like permease